MIASRLLPKTGRQRKWHRGTATVELAVCLPLLVTLVFGSIQACNLFYLRHALTIAAYEGSLAVSKPDATTAAFQSRVNNILDSLGIKEAQVTLSPSIELAEMPPGVEVSITVTAPTGINTIGPDIVTPNSQATVRSVSLR